MSRRPNSLAARLRKCPKSKFWRKGRVHSDQKVPDHNAALAWYAEKFYGTTDLRALIKAEDFPPIPSFQRAVAQEANARRMAGVGA